MNSVSESYFRTRMTPHPRRREVWRVIVRYIESWAPIMAQDRVLELGAGYCDFINQVRARERHALDLSESVQQFAEQGVSVNVGSCSRLAAFADGSMNVVFAGNLLEHLSLEDIRRTLSEAFRVLASGGRLVVLQPNFRYCYRTFYDDYTHLTPLTHESMRDLAEGAGFFSVRIQPRVLPFSFKSALPPCPALVWLYLRSPWRPWAAQLLLSAVRP